MAASNSNITRLNAVIAILERLESDFRVFQGQYGTRIQLLWNGNKLSKVEIAHLKAGAKEIGKRNTSRLEGSVWIIYADEAANGIGETVQVNDAVAKSTHDSNKEEDKTWKANNSALKTKCFMHVPPCIPVELFVESTRLLQGLMRRPSWAWINLTGMAYLAIRQESVKIPIHDHMILQPGRNSSVLVGELEVRWHSQFRRDIECYWQTSCHWSIGVRQLQRCLTILFQGRMKRECGQNGCAWQASIRKQTKNGGDKTLTILMIE